MQPGSPTPARYTRTRTQQGALVVTVTEPRLQGDSLANALKHELMAAVSAGGTNRVVLDLQPVLAISSAALRPLLSLQKAMEEKGTRLVVCGLSPVVSEVLQTTRLIGMGQKAGAPFEVEPDVLAALARLNTPE